MQQENLDPQKKYQQLMNDKQVTMMNGGIGRGIISGANNFGKGAFRIPSPKKKPDEKSSNNFRGSAE